MWTSIATFLNNVLGYIGDIVTTITGNEALAVFVLAIPIVGVSIGFLQRLVKRTFR